jgi:PAS domain S-box-containing protein
MGQNRHTEKQSGNVRESEESLRSFFMQAPAAIAILEGPEHIYRLANPLYQTLFGRTENQLLQRPLREVFPEVEGQGIYELFQQVYTTGTSFVSAEFPATFSDGGVQKTGYYNFIVHPIKTPTGEVSHLMVHAYEVTDQVLSRKKMEESEKRFRTLAETLPQLVWITDERGAYEYASSRWTAFSGLDPREEATWTQLVHPEDMSTMMQAWLHSLQSGTPYEAQARLRDKRGEYKWHLVQGMPVYDGEGKIVRWIGAFADIHDQKTFAQKLEAMVAERTKELQQAYDRMSEQNWELQTAQAFVEQIIDSSVEFISVLDKNLQYITVNRKFEEAMGLSKKELEGRHVFAVNPAAKDTLQHESIQKALLGETVYLNKRKALARPDYYVDTYFVPLRIGGEVEGVIILSRNVTDIVKSEKLLEQKNRELERSNENLQQFAHVASHDLKEPMRKVKTFASRLRDDPSSQFSAAGQLYLQKIDSAADRMFSMIEGVLTYSALTGGGQVITKVGLQEVMQAIEADIEVSIHETGAKLAYAGLPQVEGAPVLLYQLLYNLVNNAIKFVNKGQPPRITITAAAFAKEGEKWVKLEVSDNGIGFEQEEAEMIFQTFTRLNPKHRFEGTGLGLSLCKNIAERHGGTIEAMGVPGEGATFTICLPMKQPTGRLRF